MGHHAHHMQMFKRKFWISLALTIPILLLSETIQTWLGLTWIKIPYQQGILLVLSAIIYIYGGLPFLQGMVEEVRKRQPGMMTLIGTAISVAFFYSAATVLSYNGHGFLLGTRHANRRYASGALDRGEKRPRRFEGA